MSNGTLDQPGKATELAAKASLEDGALELVLTTMTARQAMAALLAAGRHRDALRVAAHALPRREAVWWGCQCFRAAPSQSDTPAQIAAVELAEKWVVSPNEETRRAAGNAAEPAQIGTGAGQIAMAAFWSGGSIGPPKLATIPPPEHLLPGAVSNAAFLAGIRHGPKQAGAMYERYLALALEVAEGKNRWKEASSPQRMPPVPPKR